MMNRQMRRQMKQLQGLQDRMQKAQDELAQETVEATSGGGAVRVVVSGRQEIKSLKISPEVIDPEEPEMLEDLILAALREGIQKSQDMASERLGGLTGGINIPGLT